MPTTPTPSGPASRFLDAPRHRELDAVLDASDGPNPLALLAYADWLDGLGLAGQAEALRWAAERGRWPRLGWGSQSPERGDSHLGERLYALAYAHYRPDRHSRLNSHSFVRLRLAWVDALLDREYEVAS